MALKGSLSEFSVAEVMQLLALQQKSGVLVLSHEDKRKYIMFFERGKILAAADRRRESRHPFLGYLLENLHINRQQMETVEDISRETGQDIFTVLLTTGLTGRDRLQEEMHRYCQRMMDDVVGWKSGEYEFSGDERSLPHQGITVKISPEELLMESMRRSDELTTLRDSLISSDLVLTRAPNPPPDPLPRECTVVLNLVDGKRTVEDVCRRSPMGDYLTYDAVAELLGRQQVIVVDAVHAARLAGRRSLNPGLGVVAWALLVIPVGLSFLLGGILGPRIASPAAEGWLPSTVEAHRAAERAALIHEVLRLEQRLDQ